MLVCRCIRVRGRGGGRKLDLSRWMRMVDEVDLRH